MMAFNYIMKASYVAIVLLVLSLFLSSNYYSDSFFAFLLNLPFKIDPFLVRLVLAFLTSYFLLILFHQLTHKHPWPLSYIIFLSFLFSPAMLKNIFLLSDLPFLLTLPFVVLSYIAFRYNYYSWGLFFMALALLDPRAVAAFIPILVMHYVKHKNPVNILITALLLLYYLYAHPVTSFSPTLAGTLLVFSALSLAFFEEVRPLVGFLLSLPFLNNPYVIYPLIVVALDVMHRVSERGPFHKHLAVSLIVFFLVLYLLWGLPFSKVLGAALLATIFFGALSYLTKNVGEYFYVMLFLTVLVEIALGMAFFVNLELYGIDLETAKAIAQLPITHYIGSAYFYEYFTGKTLEPYTGGEGTVVVPLYAVNDLYKVRLDTKGEGLHYPIGEHTILYLPYGSTMLDKALSGVVVYDSPTAVVVRH